MKVSVVVTAFNAEDKLEDCLKSVKEVAHEIIVVDSSSTDNTAQIAKKYTDKVFRRENYPMFNTNKNFGFEKATSSWILNLDSDEQLTKEAVDEIKTLKEDVEVNGYYLPRKNIIFGKWIENTGWYPDYQLRLFRKGRAVFEEKHIHEMITLDGEVGHLKGAIYHLNYDNLTHFLDKMIKNYTVSEANSKLASGYQFDFLDMFKMPIGEFMSRYFSQKGYRDGTHGLVLSLLMSFYHFVVFLRLWEANNYKEHNDVTGLLQEGVRFGKKEYVYWSSNKRINDERSGVKKKLLKLRRKIHLS